MDVMKVGLLEGAALCLFKNNYTPVGVTILIDLVECDFDGYSRINLTGWPAATLDGNNKASTELAFKTFTMTGITTPNDVYGIFVLDGLGNLLYAERNPGGPVTMNTNGQTYSYKPVFTDRSEF